MSGGEERGGRTRPRSKGKRKDTEGGMKLPCVLHGDVTCSVCCLVGEIGREKHEVKDGAARRERRQESVCCQIWVTRLFLTLGPNIVTPRLPSQHC